jgi:predicted RND superfamily exporter protein
MAGVPLTDDEGRDDRKKRPRSSLFKKDTDRIYSRETAREVDETIDRMVSQIGDRTPEYTRRAKGIFKETQRRLKDLDEKSESYTQRMFKSKPLDTIMEGILKYRKTVFTLTVILSIFIAYWGVVGPGYIQNNVLGDSNEKTRLQGKIRGDFEAYLPGGSDAEKILMEMKKNWSTDLATIFVETNNKFDPTDETNITDYNVLKEISEVEEYLNYDKKDKGANDGIIYCFSISTLIKTLHNMTNSIEEAFLNELPRNLFNMTLPDQYKGNYTIPEDQRLIDEFFSRIGPDQISSLVADINGDGIYDSALLLIGLSKSLDTDQLVNSIESKISPYYVDSGIRPGSEDTTDEWMERYEDGEVHCRMTLTGPTPLARMISKRTISEMAVVLPWAIAMVAASLLIFHRTWKIWIITLVPVIFSLLISFGLMGWFLKVLTPQVVLVAPILIALGVAYGLYIANRYAEETSIKDKEKRIRYALRTTGKAIFLSAMTTAFGFGAMLTVNMPTMQVLGFGLSSGILACYVTTILMTPSLVIWLDYKKVSKGEGSISPTSKRIAEIPMKHSRKIIIGGIILAVFSIALSPISELPFIGIEAGGTGVVKANMDYITISPADEPVVQKLQEQSETFGSGQIEMMIYRGERVYDNEPVGNPDGRDDEIAESIKDIETLKKIEKLQRRINGDPYNPGDDGIENAQSISIVDIMKMVQIPDFRNSTAYKNMLAQLERIPTREIIIDDPVETFDRWIQENLIGRSFWSIMSNEITVPAGLDEYILKEPLDVFLMNIFYNAMGLEIRGMLVNDDYSKTIMYITLPNMDIIGSEKAVNDLDEAIDDRFDMSVKDETNTASPTSGFAKVLVTINEVIVMNANQSTLTALIMVFILLFLVMKSWRISLITLLPVALVVLWQYFAIWGVGALGDSIWGAENLFSGELNLFSALIGSIIIGIGVDFSIHITERVREKNFALEGALHAAETSGWSFIESTVTMIMGLTAVFLVNIPSIREFILLIIILLAFSAYGAIFILTAAYRIYLPRYNRLRTVKKRS